MEEVQTLLEALRRKDGQLCITAALSEVDLFL